MLHFKKCKDEQQFIRFFSDGLTLDRDYYVYRKSDDVVIGIITPRAYDDEYNEYLFSVALVDKDVNTSFVIINARLESTTRTAFGDCVTFSNSDGMARFYVKKTYLAYRLEDQ